MPTLAKKILCKPPVADVDVVSVPELAHDGPW